MFADLTADSARALDCTEMTAGPVRGWHSPAAQKGLDLLRWFPRAARRRIVGATL
jgi:hypothetical protein